MQMIANMLWPIHLTKRGSTGDEFVSTQSTAYRNFYTEHSLGNTSMSSDTIESFAKMSAVRTNVSSLQSRW